MDIIQRAGEEVPWEGRRGAGQSIQMGEGEKDEGREAGDSLGDPDSALMRDRWAGRVPATVGLGVSLLTAFILESHGISEKLHD